MTKNTCVLQIVDSKYYELRCGYCRNTINDRTNTVCPHCKANLNYDIKVNRFQAQETITEYHKFVKIGDMSNEFIQSMYKQKTNKEILMKELNVSLSVLENLTLPVYEEIPEDELFNDFENHPELFTIERVAGKAQIMSVRGFFVITYKNEPEAMKEVDLVLSNI